jgi:hypothetical protein
MFAKLTRMSRGMTLTLRSRNDDERREDRGQRVNVVHRLSVPRARSSKVSEKGARSEHTDKNRNPEKDEHCPGTIGR